MPGSRFLLPVTIRGEVPGRAMRGSADLGVQPPQNLIQHTLYRAVPFALLPRLALPLIRLPPPSPRGTGRRKTTPAASAISTPNPRSGRGRSASRPGCST
ncbi:hypothetical protein FJ957_24085 [Mesorhizobium sp. B2-4-6]|nr:hypothetical protein FJ957_24085 [Mesorhizobium sp. B2-4-6]